MTLGRVITPGQAIDAATGAVIATPLKSAMWCARLARVVCTVLVGTVALSVTPALAQTDAEPESATPEPVEVVPSAPAPPVPTLEPEEAAPSTPPVSAPT